MVLRRDGAMLARNNTLYCSLLIRSTKTGTFCPSLYVGMIIASSFIFLRSWQQQVMNYPNLSNNCIQAQKAEKITSSLLPL